MTSTRRSGIALPLALAGIVLIGILAASGLYLAAHERRAGENAALAERALAAAESGIGGVIESWDAEGTAALPLGDGPRHEVTASGAFAQVELTRVGPRTFWATAEGRSARGHAEARRRLNAVLRIAVPSVAVGAALASGGLVTLAPGAAVNGGADGCDSASGLAGVAGILVADPADALGNLERVTGDPPVLAGLDVAGLLAPGSPAHAWLAEAATVVLAGGAIPVATRPAGTGELCDTTQPTNWGEPRAGTGGTSCERYRRVVHARGDLRLEGDHRGQGILLVDGDLVVPGRLEYRGLVIVHGRLDVPGELQLQGAAIANGAGNPGGSWLGPNSVVQYRQCEIDRALTSAGRPVLARDRGWADLF